MECNELSTGIRTVSQIADYFQELKATAAQLASSITAQERGYFTPHEEDQVLALLVSYCKTRSALLDVIVSMRREAETNAANYDACFLVAFAAAATLVDGARFLRETVHHRPLVREKLNEPAAPFGIPENTYDSIQRSLLSARNGWHLYHAIHYFRDHVPSLKKTADEHEARQMIDLIERFQPRLDISVTQFTRARLRTRGSQLARQAASLTVGRAMYGLQKLVGVLLSNKYVRPGHTPQLPADVERNILDQLLPGDILVVRKEYALTNYFLPGYWPHAALFLGKGRDAENLITAAAGKLGECEARMLALARTEAGIVLESMKDGVHLRSLASPFASDSIVVLRSRLPREDITKGLLRVLAHEQKPYDFSFDFRRSDRLVCTEVVYRAFDGMGSLRFPLVRRAGRPTLSGSDLLQMAITGDQIEPVALFAPGLVTRILYGDEARPVIGSVTHQ